MTLTHFNAEGHAHMVDVADKSPTDRLAIAEASVVMTPETLVLVLAGTAAKGDVLGVARLAGIMAAKRTADLIPLCHPLPLTQASVDFAPDTALPGVRIRATVRTHGNTGVEMEALTAATVAALTIYDMLKAAEKGMRIEGVHLALKEGGKSGRYAATGSGTAR
ncbi:cyclic pyranopterin monophosphate synthase MoaC [Pontitalea aquivivens]|uniref:cyclic pyranopterin monophosphate synthase MoaC n=1 Tax=Pontitalea aquivivens TaxID=3388663 RepID=UPI003970F1FD